MNGLYQISNFGNVKSLNLKGGSLLKPELISGYLRIGLYKNNNYKHYLIHRLVAETFIPNPDNLPQVNHKDENKTNNNVENLEWCDRKYNMNYGTRNEKHFSKLRKKVAQYTLDGELIKIWDSTQECTKYGFHQANVSACARGKINTAYGFKWIYVNNE